MVPITHTEMMRASIFMLQYLYCSCRTAAGVRVEEALATHQGPKFRAGSGLLDNT
jgi:hypothetical protein